MDRLLKIYNGRLITPAGIINHGSVLIRGGKIEAVASGNIDAPGAVEIDARGNYVSPGFIDIHLHGGGGYDFMDGTVEAFLKIAETHAVHGTTSMLPTSLTSSKENILHILSVYEKADTQNKQGAVFLGMHLEGPYFAMSQRGAQDPKYIRNPDPEEYREILAKHNCIKRWSAAPELDGAIEFARFIQSKGVLPSLAHTDAIYEEIEPAFLHGYKLATHLYSGMSGVTRRNAFRFAGAVESAFLLDDMYVEIIADGIHLPAPLLKLIMKIKGPARTALVTDAMRAAGTTDSNSILGSFDHGLPVIIEDGVAKLPDRSSFAGSIATADTLVRTMVNMASVTITDAIQMITATPARILNIDNRKGFLTAHHDADIVLFDDNIQVHMTIIEGRIVFQNFHPDAN